MNIDTIDFIVYKCCKCCKWIICSNLLYIWQIKYEQLFFYSPSCKNMLGR